MNSEFTIHDILNFEQRYRAAFINSIGGFKSLVLIGTKSKEGQSNLAIFNSFFHVGASPPLFGFIVRPDSVERHTLSNILETGVMTINHVREDFFKEAHQTSARYPMGISEFKAAKLTEEYKSDYFAPFVKESAVKIAGELKQQIVVTENGTTIILAQMKFVSLPENCLMPDGFVDLEKAGTITCSGLDSYHKTEKLARLSYAKIDKLPDEF